MSGPTIHELRMARDHFRTLLERTTNESEWQRFFSNHPYVLSMSLPLRIEPTDIIPLGRYGKAEPDIIFYPRDIRPIPFYGVVELKRPDSKILTLTRSNVVLLSRDAETAIEQARFYASTAKNLIPIDRADRLLFLGNSSHLFVIMGSSQELITKLGNDIYKEIVERKLPENLQLIPYDILLQLFESHLPPRVYFLAQGAEEGTITEEQFEITGRVERASFNSISGDIPEKGNWWAVVFFESNYEACIVIKKIGDVPTSGMQDLQGKMNSTYPLVRVTAKNYKGNIVPSTFICPLYEAVSDFQEL